MFGSQGFRVAPKSICGPLV